MTAKITEVTIKFGSGKTLILSPIDVMELLEIIEDHKHVWEVIAGQSENEA